MSRIAIWIRAIAREILGLFVDDGSFAVAILLWLGLMRFAAFHIRFGVPDGLVLAAGLLVILLENLVRSALRK